MTRSAGSSRVPTHPDAHPDAHPPFETGRNAQARVVT